jgi:hypothetical protein
MGFLNMGRHIGHTFNHGLDQYSAVTAPCNVQFLWVVCVIVRFVGAALQPKDSRELGGREVRAGSSYFKIRNTFPPRAVTNTCYQWQCDLRNT